MPYGSERRSFGESEKEFQWRQFEDITTLNNHVIQVGNLHSLTPLFTSTYILKSSLADVIKTRNSISISIPLALTSFFNAIFWTIYGLFVNDIFIYLSNAFGVVFAITQLVLVLVFKRRKVEIVEIPPPQRSNTASYDSTNENLNALI